MNRRNFLSGAIAAVLAPAVAKVEPLGLASTIDQTWREASMMRVGRIGMIDRFTIYSALNHQEALESQGEKVVIRTAPDISIHQYKRDDSIDWRKELQLHEQA